MSLLDRGTDLVKVYPEVAGTDADGNPARVAGAAARTVRGRVQPVDAAESAAEGQAVVTTYRLICRSFPAGAFARVVWDGRDWDVVGEPQRSRGSLRTAHVTVLLQARAPERLPIRGT